MRVAAIADDVPPARGCGTFYAARPFGGKHPRVGVDPESYYSKSPAWRISLLETADPYGWHGVGREKLLEVRSKLAQFETMTWADILQRSNGRHHFIGIERLCREARARLEAIGQDDIDEVLSLRLSGTERVFGVMEAGILKVLWWNPNHLICPAVLKHT